MYEDLIQAVRAALIAGVAGLPPSFNQIVPAGSVFIPNPNALPSIIIIDGGEQEQKYSQVQDQWPQTVNHPFTVKVFAIETNSEAANVRIYLKAVMQALKMSSLAEIMYPYITPKLLRTVGSNKVGYDGDVDPGGHMVYTGTVNFLGKYNPAY